MSRTIRKTKRKGLVADGKVPYAASSCRHHGSCPYCESNRTFERVEELPLDLISYAETEIDQLDFTVDTITVEDETFDVSGGLIIESDFDFSEFDNYPVGHPMSFGAEIQRHYLDGFNEIINRSKDTQADKIVGIPSGMSREELYEYIKSMRDHVRKEQGLERLKD